MGAIRRRRVGLRAHWAAPMGRICCAVTIAVALGVAELAAAPASMAATAGLVAAYGFDEGSGTTVTDASGNGNTGTITNATWAATGKYGKALQFNGTNALVTIPDAASLHLSTGMTLEAWVNPSTVNANWRDVIYKGNDNYYLEATSTNASKPDAGMIAGGSYADAFGTAALTANTWSYLTETYDGSTLRLYVNGTQVASTAHTGTIATSTNPLQIGGDSLYGQYFAGLIDEVRVYNVALTAAQIQTDMATPVNDGPDTTPPTQPGTLTATAVSAPARSTCPGVPPPTTSASPATRSSAAQGTGCTNFAQIGTTTGTGTTYKDTSVGRLHQLQLPRPRHRRRRQPQHLLEHRQRHHPHARHDPADAAGDADRERGSAPARSTCPGAPPPTTSASPATRSSAARAAGCTNFAQIGTTTGTGTTYKDTSVGRLHQLQLPRPRHRRRRQPQPLLEHRQRHHPRRPVRAGRGVRV